MWTYGITLQGSSGKYNIFVSQIFQTKCLRIVTEALWFVSNKFIHLDLKIHYVTEDIVKLAEKYLLK